jgi:hypothetical protein
MPGRDGPGFAYAIYTLRQDGNDTILTRSTTIISNLYSAWYGRPCERWGTTSAHSHLFSDLAHGSQR